MTEKEYLTITELSSYLSIKTATLYAKAERREIPCYKIGRLLRFRKSEIDQWMEGLKRIPVDVDKAAKNIFNGLDDKNIDIDSLIKKAIEDSTLPGYNLPKREIPQGQASERRGNGII